MALLNNTLSILVNQRITWLNARGNVLVSNIANADNSSATRKELKSFKEVIAHSPRRIKNSGYGVSEVRDVKITDDDVITTKSEIAREVEMLEMSNNSLEHDSLINIVRNFHKMMKSVLGKGQ